MFNLLLSQALHIFFQGDTNRHVAEHALNKGSAAARIFRDCCLGLVTKRVHIHYGYGMRSPQNHHKNVLLGTSFHSGSVYGPCGIRGLTMWVF